MLLLLWDITRDYVSDIWYLLRRTADVRFCTKLHSQTFRFSVALRVESVPKYTGVLS